MEFPEGVTDADFVAALRVMLCAMRRQENEDKTAYHNRLTPAVEALFGNKDQRDPAKEAAVKILCGSSKADQFVSALRKSSKKSNTETEN